VLALVIFVIFAVVPTYDGAAGSAAEGVEGAALHLPGHCHRGLHPSDWTGQPAFVPLVRFRPREGENYAAP
jgi:hypothetical protein